MHWHSEESGHAGNLRCQESDYVQKGKSGVESPQTNRTQGLTRRKVALQRDLGVLTDSKVAPHGTLLAKQANRILGCFRSVAISLREVILPLYSAGRWFPLECYVQFCILQSKRDRNLLVQHQHELIKMIHVRRGRQSWDWLVWRRNSLRSSFPCV